MRCEERVKAFLKAGFGECAVGLADRTLPNIFFFAHRSLKNMKYYDNSDK